MLRSRVSGPPFRGSGTSSTLAADGPASRTWSLSPRWRPPRSVAMHRFPTTRLGGRYRRNNRNASRMKKAANSRCLEERFFIGSLLNVL